MHWAERYAKKLAKYDNPTIATGITPSGPIHIGNSREVITADAIYKILSKGKLIFIADTFDPLRKVYPFLPEEYEEYRGKPLSEIPCICGSHENYAEHFLEPFLKSCEKLGIEMEVYRVHELYKNGYYKEMIKVALENASKIREILNKYRKEKLAEDWSPYMPKCKNCGKMVTTEVVAFDGEWVEYTCKSCGHKGKARIERDDGKLRWRIDWPARWKIFDVHCEPLGKDHASSGGSFDTGKQIALQVFNQQPPIPVVYEWVHLKGKGAMSS